VSLLALYLSSVVLFI